MAKIRYINPLSVGKILGILYVIVGFFIGAFFSLISVFSAAFSSQAGIFAVLFGIGAIIALPIFYGAMGFLMGIIMAWLYNIIAKKVGGIEVETE